MKTSGLGKIGGLLLALPIAFGAIAFDAGRTAADPGMAWSGAANAFGKTYVFQRNVQIIGGNQATRDNSTQTATNVVIVDQENVAVSGDTTATNGGLARSGTATAGSVAVVTQMNIQIIAGRNCSVDQVASNYADISQTAVAVSGDASADGAGSHATTGNAMAMNTGFVYQRNLQVYVCTGSPGSTGGGQQYSVNNGTLQQTAVGVSGDASAAGGFAGSGDATTHNRARLDQVNRQITID